MVGWVVPAASLGSAAAGLAWTQTRPSRQGCGPLGSCWAQQARPQPPGCSVCEAPGAHARPQGTTGPWPTQAIRGHGIREGRAFPPLPTTALSSGPSIQPPRVPVRWQVLNAGLRSGWEPAVFSEFIVFLGMR